MNSKGCAFINFTLHVNFAVMTFDNPIANEKAQAGSIWFSGVEWIKDIIDFVLWNTKAIIYKLNDDLIFFNCGVNT